MLVRTHHELDTDRFVAPTASTERGYASFLGTQLGEPDVIVLVAERGGEVVGYTYAGIEGTDYERAGFQRTMIEMTREAR